MGSSGCCSHSDSHYCGGKSSSVLKCSWDDNGGNVQAYALEDDLLGESSSVVATGTSRLALLRGVALTKVDKGVELVRGDTDASEILEAVDDMVGLSRNHGSQQQDEKRLQHVERASEVTSGGSFAQRRWEIGNVLVKVEGTSDDGLPELTVKECLESDSVEGWKNLWE